MKPEEIIEEVLNELIYEATPIYDERSWARELVLSRLSEMKITPTEAELFNLMKLRMKV